MGNSHKSTLYLAYYLLRFNYRTYTTLGYVITNEAHKNIGEMNGINTSYVHFKHKRKTQHNFHSIPCEKLKPKKNIFTSN